MSAPTTTEEELQRLRRNVEKSILEAIEKYLGLSAGAETIRNLAQAAAAIRTLTPPDPDKT